METEQPTPKKIANPSSLSSVAAKSFGTLFHKDPYGSLKSLRNVPHLANEIIPNIPPYFLGIWWELHNDPVFSKIVDSALLSQQYELYEAAYLHRFKGKPLEPVKEDEDSAIPPVPLPLPEKFEDSVLDVWKEWDSFVLEPLNDEESKYPKMYYSAEPPKIASFKGESKVHSLVPKDEFLERFHIFTNNQFKDWDDWDNMLVIGGTMVACGQDIPSEYKTKEQIAKYYHEIAYPASDIDIYFYGLNEEKFRAKVMKLWKHLLKVHSGKVSILRTTFTLTFVSQYPNRHIQIVLGSWASPAEILLEPDVDCTCIGLQGGCTTTGGEWKLWATHRSRVSWNKRIVYASQRRYCLRAFPEYETRLKKYGERGFYIADANLKRFNQVSQRFLAIGESRILEHKIVQGRTDITGLRLMLLGFVSPEVHKYVNMFQPEKYPDGSRGLAYGPTVSWEKITEKVLLEPVFEASHYGPYKVKNPYKIVGSSRTPSLALVASELEKIIVKLHNINDVETTSWRRSHGWYSRALKTEDDEEVADIKKSKRIYDIRQKLRTDKIEKKRARREQRRKAREERGQVKPKSKNANSNNNNEFDDEDISSEDDNNRRWRHSELNEKEEKEVTQEALKTYYEEQNMPAEEISTLLSEQGDNQGYDQYAYSFGYNSVDGSYLISEKTWEYNQSTVYTWDEDKGRVVNIKRDKPLRIRGIEAEGGAVEEGGEEGEDEPEEMEEE